MPSPFSPCERRLLVPSGPPRDENLFFWHGSDAELWLGLFKLDETTPLVEADFTGVTALHLEIYSAVRPPELLVAKTLSVAAVDFTVSKDDFVAGNAAHIIFELTAFDLTLTMPTLAGRFNYVVYVNIGTARKVLMAGKLFLLRSNAAFETASEENELDWEGNPILDYQGNPIQIVQ
jgi:hypothetical protein